MRYRDICKGSYRTKIVIVHISMAYNRILQSRDDKASCVFKAFEGKDDFEQIMIECNTYFNNDQYIFIFLLPENTRWALTVLRYCIKNGIDNYAIIDKEEYRDLHISYYRKYFLAHGVCLDSDVIKVGDWQFTNYFKDPYGELDFGDSLLPVLWNDFSLVNEGPYEYDAVQMKKGDVVIDCGANIGFFSAIALNKGCFVHAFEPYGQTVKHLKKNLSVFRLDSYVIEEIAVAEDKYFTQLNLYEYSEGNSMVFRRGSMDCVSVMTTSLDIYVKEHRLGRVDFIKADVEGAERLLIQGAKETIKQFKPRMSICTYHKSDDAQVLEKMLLNIEPRYTICHKWKKLYAYVPE